MVLPPALSVRGPEPGDAVARTQAARAAVVVQGWRCLALCFQVAPRRLFHPACLGRGIDIGPEGVDRTFELLAAGGLRLQTCERDVEVP